LESPSALPRANSSGRRAQITYSLEEITLASSSGASLSRETGVAVSGVMLAIFLFAIDATIVSAAMPTVVAKLGGLELYSWVFSTYMLTSALLSGGPS